MRTIVACLVLMYGPHQPANPPKAVSAVTEFMPRDRLSEVLVKLKHEKKPVECENFYCTNDVTAHNHGAACTDSCRDFRGVA